MLSSGASTLLRRLVTSATTTTLASAIATSAAIADAGHGHCRRRRHRSRVSLCSLARPFASSSSSSSSSSSTESAASMSMADRHPLLPFASSSSSSSPPSYVQLRDHFRWRVPEYYNIGVDVCDKHVAQGHGADTAMIFQETSANGGDSDTVRRYTFRHIRDMSNRLANALSAPRDDDADSSGGGEGIGRGDRVGIMLPQCPETAIAHVAIHKCGAVSVPLFCLFGPEALQYRLAHARVTCLVTDEAGLTALLSVLPELPDLRSILLVTSSSSSSSSSSSNASFGNGTVIDGRVRVKSFTRQLERASPLFTPVRTRADDPAILIYTSGTTGQPKGCVHAHRVLLGHLPGVEMFTAGLGAVPGDTMWTPADWAWVGGLLDVLLPAWHHRVPVLAYRASKFDPHHAFHMMARHAVTTAFMPPTALKLMRDSGASFADSVGSSGGAGHRLRSCGSGGESLGGELLEWGRATLGAHVNEFYGQTECNMVLSNNADVFDVRAGSTGRPVPGHHVTVLHVDDDNDEAEGGGGRRARVADVGESGQIAVRADDDPVVFLEYWDNARATADKFAVVARGGGHTDADTDVDDAGTRRCRVVAGERYLLMGDEGLIDADGYVWFVGRDDDVITTSGYRVGPGEIEDCLLGHPAVATCAVIGKPDAVRTEIVKAFIVLRHRVDGVAAADDTSASSPVPSAAAAAAAASSSSPPLTQSIADAEGLKRDIQDYVKRRLARHEYPREIEFVTALPMTTTGKIIRKALKQREIDKQQQQQQQQGGIAAHDDAGRITAASVEHTCC